MLFYQGSQLRSKSNLDLRSIVGSGRLGLLSLSWHEWKVAICGLTCVATRSMAPGEATALTIRGDKVSMAQKTSFTLVHAIALALQCMCLSSQVPVSVCF